MTGIAIIGMAGRFPGAPDLAGLWSLLENGREGITRLDRAALLAEGVPAATIDDPRYIPAAAALEGIDRFDAAFWGIAPHEAALMDPQQRVFLETAWAALEDAAYDPAQFAGLIGVYAGMGNNTYFTRNVIGWKTRIAIPAGPMRRSASSSAPPSAPTCCSACARRSRARAAPASSSPWPATTRTMPRRSSPIGWT